MKSGFISKLVIKSEASNFKVSLANEKESFVVYPLLVRGLSKWSQNLAILYIDVPIVDKIEGNDGIASCNTLWILTNPYITPRLEPDGHKSTFFSFSESSPCSSRSYLVSKYSHLY